MMRRWTIATALLVACGMGVTATFAGPGEQCHKDKKAECAKKCEKTCDKKAMCSDDKDFPAMAIMVGDKTTHCPMEARKIAAENHAKVVYAVAGDKYDDMNKAMVALADASEAYLNDYMAIKCRVDGKLITCAADCGAKGEKTGCGTQAKKVADKGGCDSHAKKVADKDDCDYHAKKAAHEGTCDSKSGKKVADKSGCCPSKKASEAKLAKCDPSKCAEKCSEFVVMGRTFKSWKDAAEAREEALCAAKAVKVAYIVNGEKVDCSSKVCPKAKAAGKVKYVVNGEETDCDANFRVMVAKAKYEAANEALSAETTKTAKM